MSSACSCWPKLDSLNGVSFSWDDRRGQEGSGSWACQFRGHQLKQREEQKAVEKALGWDSGGAEFHWLSVQPGWITEPFKEDQEGVFAHPGLGGLSFPWTGSGKLFFLPGESFQHTNLVIFPVENTIFPIQSIQKNMWESPSGLHSGKGQQP